MIYFETVLRLSAGAMAIAGKYALSRRGRETIDRRYLRLASVHQVCWPRSPAPSRSAQPNTRRVTKR